MANRIEMLEKYSEELAVVEEKLIGARLVKDKIDSYDENVAKTIKGNMENFGLGSLIYGVLTIITKPEFAFENIAFVTFVYAIIDAFSGVASNYRNLTKIKNINVLDLELKLYEYFERYKGLLNGKEEILESMSEEEIRKYVKKRK